MSLWYLTGTVTLTSGSNDVTGVGTAWLANAKANDIFYTPSGGMYEVLSVSGNGALRLVAPYSGPTMAGVAYAIISTQGFNTSLAMAMTELIPELARIRDAYAAGADPAAAAEASAQAARDILAGALKTSDLPEEGAAADKAPSGSLVLGITPGQRFAAFTLESLLVGGALRFNQAQALSAEEQRLAVQNIGLDEAVRRVLPAGGAVGQFPIRTANGYAWADFIGGVTPSIPPVTSDDLDELAYQGLEAIARAAALEFAALAAQMPTEAGVDADEASYQELEALAISATAQFNADAKALTEALAT